MSVGDGSSVQPNPLIIIVPFGLYPHVHACSRILQCILHFVRAAWNTRDAPVPIGLGLKGRGDFQARRSRGRGGGLPGNMVAPSYNMLASYNS